MVMTLERKPKAEVVQRMYLVLITPPDGPKMIGVRPAVSEEAVRQDYMARTGKTRQEIAGRVSVTLLRPKKGMEYREAEFTVTRKSEEEFLNSLLVSIV